MDLINKIGNAGSRAIQSFSKAVGPYIQNLTNPKAQIQKPNYESRARDIKRVVSNFMNSIPVKQEQIKPLKLDEIVNNLYSRPKMDFKINVPKLEMPGTNQSALRDAVNMISSGAGKAAKYVADQPIVSSRNLFKAPSVKDTLEFGREAILQPAARGVVEIGLSRAPYKNAEIRTRGPVVKFLFGDKPLQSLSHENRPTRDFLRGQGMNETTTNTIAPFIIGLGLFADITPFGIGKKKIGKELIEQGTKLSKDQAKASLRSLLTYENELAKRGYSANERAKLSSKKAQELFGSKLVEQAERKKQAFNQYFKEFIGDRDVAKTTGIEIGSKFRAIPLKMAEEVIDTLEGVSKSPSKLAKGYAKAIKEEYDILYKRARDNGISMRYVDDYLTHIWKDNEASQLLKLQSTVPGFRFSKKRTINSYKAGREQGLLPEYETPQEILAVYVRRLENAKANIDFLGKLKAERLISDKFQEGYLPIIAEGFPKVSKLVDGKRIDTFYHAPADIANQINHVFKSQEPTNLLEKVFDKTAKAASTVQNITLSGGLPYTPANFFTYSALLQKELLAAAGGLNSKQAVRAGQDFLRSFSAGKSNEFFKANLDQIKKLQARNVPINTTLDMDHLVNRGAIKNLLGEGALNNFDKAFGEPTFKRLMPQLMVNLFTEIEQAALKKGLGSNEAADLGANAVKRFYGVITSDKRAKSNKLVEDIKTTFLFAPTYRATLINLWTDSAKAISPVKLKDGKIALNNPLSLENKTNSQFIFGSIAAYFTYDAINKHFTGNSMADNPAGMEDKILIPVSKITGDESDTTVIGVPYLSSLGFLPRTVYKLGKHAVEGDLPAVTKDASGFASTFIRTPLDILNNENYFGQNIYKEDDPAGEKLKSMGRYAFENLQHPYIRAASERGLIPGIPAKDQKDYVTIAKMLEAPFRFYSEKSLKGRDYFAARDEVLKTLNEEQRAVYDILQKKNEEGGIIQTITEAQMRLSNWDVVKAENEIAIRTAEKNGQPLLPFAQLPEPYQKKILQIQAMPPGPEKSEQYAQNIGWLKSYWEANSEFYKQINKENPEAKDNGRPVISDELRKVQDQYFAYPKGSQERKTLLAQNPELPKYWDQKKIFDNAQRAELGLEPLPAFKPFASGFKRFGKKPRKPKKIKIALLNPKKVKAIKPPKLNIKLSRYKTKNPKLRVRTYAVN